VYSELSDSISVNSSRSQQSRGLRRGSATVCLLGLWVRIPPRAWMSVCCECCVLSGRSLCEGRSVLQSSPTECGVSECNRAASTIRTFCPTEGRRVMEKESVNSKCPRGNHMTTQAFTEPGPTEPYRYSCGCTVGKGGGGGGYRNCSLFFRFDVQYILLLNT